jgi:ribosomal subunit interface protein
MNYHIKCRHMECPPDVEEAVREKITRFERLVPETAYLEIELAQHARAHKGGDKEAEIILDIPGVKPVFRFRSDGKTYLEAVDIVLDKLDQELTRKKDRWQDRHYRGEPLKVVVADTLHDQEYNR